MTAKRLRSTVELYRSREIVQIPYDLSDPLDRAIWTVLQLYIDHIERLAILAAEEFDRPEVWNALQLYIEHPDTEGYLRSLRFLQAWELEEYLKDLRDAMQGARPMDPAELYYTARRVAEALFAPENEPITYSIPRDFWEAERESLPDGALERGETPAQLAQTLAPLAHMLRVSLGEHVSRSEAARRLSLTPSEVALRIERGQLRAIRVDGNVLVCVADLPGG